MIRFSLAFGNSLVKYLRIITLNVNGIRSAKRKGFFVWMQQQNADILFACKKQKRRYTSLIPILFVLRIITVFFMMRKKGYSRAAIYCKKQPDKIISGTGWLDAHAKGRFIEAQFGSLSVISLYSPFGSSSEERQTIKFKFMDRFMPYLQACTKKGP